MAQKVILKFHMKSQNFEFFDFTFVDILTMIYDFDLLGLT